MSLDFQNYLVYGIVFFALVKFTQPIWMFFYRSIFNKNTPVVENTSCYTGTCAKCKVKS